ncbi:MAG: tyrosine--tRNA ligase [bacterium]|nr:tyrosine--tRNA ligase [bacterium]
MNARPDFPSYLAEMKWRGFFEQCTDEAALAELMAAGPVTGYAGFDPTADSLHIGSLVPIMGLLHLQRHGHRPIAIVGGGTAMVGDPSGKTELRRLLTVDDIDRNLAGIRAQLGRFLRLGDGPGDGLMVDNGDWLRDKSYIDFLRDVGRHFSVNQMLARDSVKTRMETGLSFLEFNYMILQAYDFLVLNRDHGCRLQVGGSDQWGNICSGIDLCRRLGRAEVYGLTYPLIMTAAGEKMGKTAAGAVWLDADRTSPYDFFQYWVNVDDRDVGRFLRLYTLLPPVRVQELEALQGADSRQAKQVLALEVTALVHGAEAAQAALAAARAAFGGGGDAASIPASVHTAADLAADGLALIDVLVSAGLVESKGEARRLVRQGGVRVNGEAVADEQRRLVAADVQDGRIVLQLGKKRHHHLRIEG